MAPDQVVELPILPPSSPQNRKYVTLLAVYELIMLMRSRFSNVNVVNIFVGPKRVKFIIHEHLLRDVSTYFTAAMQPRWKEGQVKTLNLQEDDPDFFDVFAQWLYQHHGDLPRSSSLLCSQSARQLVGIYLMADKFQVLDLKKHVIDTFVQSTKSSTPKVPSPSDLERVYYSTSPKSGIRKFCKHYWCWNMIIVTAIHQDWLLANPEISADLITGMSEAMSAMYAGQRRLEMTPADYYDDVEGSSVKSE